MKTTTWALRRVGLIGLVGAGLLAETSAEQNDLRVHEWGTFTTLHWPGGSGLGWYQDLGGAVSALPAFVHTIGIGGKSRSWGGSTARMETPVLYFYTDTRQEVQVAARFQGGSITEIYPANWMPVELVPTAEAGTLVEELPIDPQRPANHYYEARAVPDAAIVRSTPPVGRDGVQPPDEIEKFLFYRGVGTFESGLVPHLQPDGALAVSHTHPNHAIDHVWALQSSADAIRWTKFPAFAPYDREAEIPPVAVDLTALDARGSREDSVAALVESMATALIAEGLTPAEASAMVATWDDQWYQERGQRVFSIPPQSLIDAVLPLEIDPDPAERVRVFVHRQEILSPETLAVLERALDPKTPPERARKMIAGEGFGRFVHGAIAAVADDVARRTRAAYYSRGMAAIEKPAEVAGTQ